MKALIKVHYTYRGVIAQQQGSFYIKKYSIPYTACEWIVELKKNMPEMEITKVLGNEEDITDEVMEKI